jgi:AP2 domain
MKTIKLGGMGGGYVAFVSDKDYARVRAFKWRAFKPAKWSRTLYAVRTDASGRRPTSVLMHRFILGLTDPRVTTDHRDRNGLNNVRSNLRRCTIGQNQFNSGKHTGRPFKGVTLESRTGKYFARIGLDRQAIHLGTFDRAEDAARAYDAKALKLYGAFACPNFFTMSC